MSIDNVLVRKHKREDSPTLPPVGYIFNRGAALHRLNVLGLQALGALHYLELHLLAFLQAAKSSRLDR